MRKQLTIHHAIRYGRVTNSAATFSIRIASAERLIDRERKAYTEPVVRPPAFVKTDRSALRVVLPAYHTLDLSSTVDVDHGL